MDEHFAEFYWADGRVEIHPFDPTADTVKLEGPDGRFHSFKATERIDPDGYDVLEEESSSD